MVINSKLGRPFRMIAALVAIMLGVMTSLVTMTVTPAAAQERVNH